MGKTGKKTDKVDAKGLGILLRNGTLPEAWIPPPELRDQRELLRLCMFLVQQRTRFKSRIQAALARYNIQLKVQDMFSANQVEVDADIRASVAGASSDPVRLPKSRAPWRLLGLLVCGDW
jgi:hypothetical protein